MTSPNSSGWDLWVNSCRWSQECQTWCQQAVEWIPDCLALVDFQTSKLVGFIIGAGDTLESFGLQESNCSHIFLKRKMDLSWFDAVAGAEKEGVKRIKRFMARSLSTGLAVFGLCWMEHKTEQVGEIWSFYPDPTIYPFKGIPSYQYFDTHLSCRKNMVLDFTPVAVFFSKKHSLSKFDASTSSVYPKLLWPNG